MLIFIIICYNYNIYTYYTIYELKISLYAHTIYHISVLYHKPQKFEDYNEKSKTIVYSELSKESVFF